MSAIIVTFGVSRHHLLSAGRKTAAYRRGRRPLLENGPVARSGALSADLPTYGYRHIHALLRGQSGDGRLSAPDAERVYQLVAVHSLLLQGHSGKADEHHNDGRVSIDTNNTRWRSDSFEIGSYNSEKMRIAFSFDC